MKKLLLFSFLVISSSVFADRQTSQVVNRSLDAFPQRSISSRAGYVSSSSRQAVELNTNKNSLRHIRGQTINRTVDRSAKNSISRSVNIQRGVGQVKNTDRYIQLQRSAKQNITGSKARVAVNKVTGNNVASSKQSYSVCKDTFFKCIDEFCANKDKQLRRCACSSRSHDFDEVRSRISSVEEKLLSFNQRLLSVNMEEGDTKAISQASKGETAFQKEDTSKSKQILDEISSKLKKAGSKSSFEKDMSSLSLSMDSTNSFDDIDSAFGQETTLKEGVELYNSALPVCLDIASEVCRQEDAKLAEETYQMAIEKDCNTIEKTYELLNEKTISKIHEGNALLDMSRLDLYKKNNSDSALLCIKKMQDAVYSKSVCGENLELCLDYTGQYIDNKTGKINLNVGENIKNFSTLINKPDKDFEDDKKVLWSNFVKKDNDNNKKFAQYITRKYEKVKSVTKVCKNMEKAAFDQFVEDSLKKIKIAQDNKIEELKQGCTTLMSECMTKSDKQIGDFDKKAISIFGVKVFRTAYQMCKVARETCNALLKIDNDKNEWVDGTEHLNYEIAYQKIRNNCMEVGRQCIIKQCKTDTGNFELCSDPLYSVNRRTILSRNACFDDVAKCVKDIELTNTNDDIIENILKYKNMVPAGSVTEIDNFHKVLYGNVNLTKTYTEDKDTKSYKCGTNSTQAGRKQNDNCIFLYADDTDNNGDKAKNFFRFVESLWGHCEKKNAELENNMIRIVNNSENETLLSWFAKQTKTNENPNSCYDDTCAIGTSSAKSIVDNTSTCVDQTIIYGGYYCPGKINATNKICLDKNNGEYKVQTEWKFCSQSSSCNFYDSANNSTDKVLEFNLDSPLKGNITIYCEAVTGEDLRKNGDTEEDRDKLLCNKWVIKQDKKVATYNDQGEVGEFGIQSFYFGTKPGASNTHISTRAICYWTPVSVDSKEINEKNTGCNEDNTGTKLEWMIKKFSE